MVAHTLCWLVGIALSVGFSCPVLQLKYLYLTQRLLNESSCPFFLFFSFFPQAALNGIHHISIVNLAPLCYIDVLPVLSEIGRSKYR